MIRVMLLLVGVTLGIAGTIAIPDVADKVRSKSAAMPGLGWLQPSFTGGREPHRDEHDEEAGIIELSAEQIEAAGIAVAEAREGTLRRYLQVPGTIIPNGERVARVSVKLLGSVAELRKRLGDDVVQGEVVAVIESREVADAKAEFLAARLTHELQQTLAARAKALADIKAFAENEYLRVRNAFEDARVRLDSARQKLSALGLTEQQIAELPQQPVGSLRQQELRAPMSGKIAERRVDVGALVGREGQESELYVIVDLADVWADLAISPADLPSIHENQEVKISAGASRESAQAAIMFVSPLLDKDTRSARVVALVPNPTHTWRPGSFVTADIPLAEQRADIVIPKSAIQSFKGEQVVFLRVERGFAKRVVKTGREDDRAIEIVAGLSGGEVLATSNTFTLKAELGKAEADHEH